MFLRATIKTRIEEINEFYEANVNDPKIHFLEKYKMKLKQWLHSKLSPELLTNNNQRLYVQEQSYEGHKGISDYDHEDLNLRESENMSKHSVDDRKNREFRPPSFSGPDVGHDGFASRHSHTAKGKVGADFQKHKLKTNIPKESKNKEWKELIFRIKLTPEEYSRYLHEKSKRL